MHFEHLILHKEAKSATIVLNRPKALNAIHEGLLHDLKTVVAYLEKASDILVVVIRGQGEKAFAAGADIAAMCDMNSKQAEAFSKHGGDVFTSIEHSKKPYIAAVHGFALGGGCELAMACDLIYASKTARFGLPEVTLGVIPGFGGTQRLMRRIGIAQAKELIYTGKTIKADEAFSLGLVNQWFDVDTCEALMEKVTTTTEMICKAGPCAIAQAKQVIHQGQSVSLEQGMALEQNQFGALFDTHDLKEGMTAFLNKKTAQFHGK